MRPLFAVLIAVPVAIGCSSGGDGNQTKSGSLDCAWFAGNNCWKSTVSQAASCLPPTSETGTLSADMKTCTYASGAVVTFDTALVLPVPQDPVWSFTVTSGGQPCLSYVDSPSGDGFTLTVKGQTFKEAILSGFGLQITCPDQSAFATSNALDLLSCESDAGIFGGSLPGYFFSDSSTSVSFGLVGAGSVNIFRCRMP